VSLADLAPELGSEVAYYLRQMELERRMSWTWKSRAIPGATVTLYRGVYGGLQRVDCTIRAADGMSRSTALSEAEAAVPTLPPVDADDQIALGLLGRRVRTVRHLLDALGIDAGLIEGTQAEPR
jgi:hypothetical protein